MQVLEDVEPVGTVELLDGVDRALGVVRAMGAPGQQQRRGQRGDRVACRLRKMRARGLILPQLDGVHAEDEPRVAIVAVDLDQTLGKLDGFIDLAAGQIGIEGKLQKLGIFRIGLERRLVIGGRRGGIALHVGGAAGEVIARGRDARELLRCGRRIRLHRERLGCECARNAGDDECREATEKRGVFHGSLLSMGSAPARPAGSRGRMACLRPSRKDSRSPCMSRRSPGIEAADVAGSWR